MRNGGQTTVRAQAAEVIVARLLIQDIRAVMGRALGEAANLVCGISWFARWEINREHKRWLSPVFPLRVQRHRPSDSSLVIPSAFLAVNTQGVIAVRQERKAPIWTSRDQLDWRGNGRRSCPSEAASAVVGRELLPPMMILSAKGGTVCLPGGGGGGGGRRSGGIEDAGWK